MTRRGGGGQKFPILRGHSLWTALYSKGFLSSAPSCSLLDVRYILQNSTTIADLEGEEPFYFNIHPMLLWVIYETMSAIDSFFPPQLGALLEGRRN